MEKVKLVDATVNATMLYWTEIWGLKYANIKESYQTKYILNILRSPFCTPDYMLRLDTGVGNIHIKIGGKNYLN